MARRSEMGRCTPHHHHHHHHHLHAVRPAVHVCTTEQCYKLAAAGTLFTCTENVDSTLQIRLGRRRRRAPLCRPLKCTAVVYLCRTVPLLLRSQHPGRRHRQRRGGARRLYGPPLPRRRRRRRRFWSRLVLLEPLGGGLGRLELLGLVDLVRGDIPGPGVEREGQAAGRNDPLMPRRAGRPMGSTERAQPAPRSLAQFGGRQYESMRCG
eukprot:SAG22_NODE_1092_length_5588_cov_12.400984_2_plen_209_part_00